MRGGVRVGWRWHEHEHARAAACPIYAGDILNGLGRVEGGDFGEDHMNGVAVACWQRDG